MKPTAARRIGRLTLALGGLLGLVGPGRAGFTPEGVEFFEKKIRPLLVENCYRCHSAGQKQKGNLRLDSRAALLQGGDTGPAIVPGRPERSLLLKAVSYTDDDLRMPPRSKLAGPQIADLTAWVKMGAPWPETAAPKTGGPAAAFNLAERRKHWAFQPLHWGPLPAVRRGDWPLSPVDAFLLAGLEAKGLAPAPDADRRTLIRRVTYDLIGLPPTPAEIDAFLADRRPGAYERLVDRLLASPHYGERWGRHWLDLVRFAETHGHEFDFEIPDAYQYRDYVIRAFNADVGYDQLVLEHVAGDLLPRPRRHPTEHFNESIIGTGFYFLGEAKHSPVDVRGDEADRADNQIDVFSKTFLGLTVSCARCHDHKFDAISTRDYYALAGYLRSSRFQRAFFEAPDRTRDLVQRVKEAQARARPLAVAVTAHDCRERLGKLADGLLKRPTTVDLRTLDAWRKADRRRIDGLFSPLVQLADPAATLTPQQFTARRQELVKRLKDRAAAAEEAKSRYLPFEGFKTSYRDWFVTGAAFGDGPSRAGDLVLRPEQPRPVRQVLGAGLAHSGLVSDRLQGVLRSPTFTISRKKVLYRLAGTGGQVNLIIDNYQLIRYPIYGGLTFPVAGGDQFRWHVQDVSMWVGHRAYVEVIDHGGGNVAVDRILFADDGPPPEAPNPLVVKLLDDPALDSPAALVGKYRQLLGDILGQWQAGRLDTAPDHAERIALLNEVLHSPLLDAVGAPNTPAADAAKLRTLADEIRRLEAALPEPRKVPAMADGTGENEHVFIRGNHRTLGPEVPRRFLEAIAGADQPAPRHGSGRLDLACRMIDPSNPLLARVMVNRLWQHHFGEGLVRSVDNFGVLGERPTHPELLDFLAGEFVRRRWSIKAMHRLMVLSHAYRMTSRPQSDGDRLDPQNRLLHRMPLRRLEAECVRDALLAVSGRLDRRQYGPGVLPYLTSFMIGRGRPPSGPLDGAGRRSIYVNVRRNFLTPMFLAFDYPIPFTTMGRRSVSNVPAQALTMMNNPFVIQQARRWADRVLAGPAASPRQRIARLYETAFGRPPSESEMSEALAFLAEQGKQYGSPDNPRAWADLCHVLVNVKEFIFIE